MSLVACPFRLKRVNGPFVRLVAWRSWLPGFSTRYGSINMNILFLSTCVFLLFFFWIFLMHRFIWLTKPFSVCTIYSWKTDFLGYWTYLSCCKSTMMRWNVILIIKYAVVCIIVSSLYSTCSNGKGKEANFDNPLNG